MSEITERTPQSVSPAGGPARGAPSPLRSVLGFLGRQREATVFVVAVVLLLYFGIRYNSTFVSQVNLSNLLSETAAPIIVIGIGEVFLLICGEIDLSAGFVYTFAPFLMHYLISFYGWPAWPAIIVSRRDPELIKKLFELEVPEIADGLVEIANVAREPGYRSKIAVISHTDGVDPVGACVGPRGSRVRMVVSELRGEKIDIIPFNDEPARFVAKALSPARVREVLVDDEAKQATVIVPDDQLSLAIGREGQNARLAARLTGWRVDIRSETEFAAEEAEHGYEEEEVQGRCAAILSNGRRCPNASLPNSRYCGLESHQALANIDSDNVGDLAASAQSPEPASLPAEAAAPVETAEERAT